MNVSATQALYQQIIKADNEIVTIKNENNEIKNILGQMRTDIESQMSKDEKEEINLTVK